jgi:hypothetical protein
MKRYWHGDIPVRCETCDVPITTSFSDCATPHGWANICNVCVTLQKCTYGIGRGQKYEKQPDGKWLKTKG